MSDHTENLRSMYPHKGRGARSNPDARFETLTHSREDDGWYPDETPAPCTALEMDSARSVITRNDSPDVPFEQAVNPYRGCEHGCIYCYARPSHAYLGLSPGLDFETRLFHKPEAPRLLQRALRAAGYRCSPIALGSNTDAYQPVERRLCLTRGILGVLRDFRHPVYIVTKSALVLRDADILRELAGQGLVQVLVSVTSLDPGLARRMEPRATAPHRRLETIRRLAQEGIPVAVLVAPVIPALTDGELEAILGAARKAGAGSAGYVLLRLPREVKGLFEDWLAQHQPGRAEHVMSLLRQMHGGQEYDARYGRRMRGEGPYAKLLSRRFMLACRRLGLAARRTPLDCTRFRVPPGRGDQLSLF
jgi:DNA repair photolyase